MSPKIVCINFLSLLAIIGICLVHLRAASSPARNRLPFFGQDSTYRYRVPANKGPLVTTLENHRP